MEYPPPKIPLTPVLSGAFVRLVKSPEESGACDSILANPHGLHVTSGRAAIALALQQSAISSGDEVLLPAYHCESMVAPAHWRGSTPVFYRINPDTSVAVEDIVSKVSPRTRALIVTHYFGFIQDMPPLVKLCQERGIVLIEDCAHAFFGSRNQCHTGGWGDYAIASSMKFFPVYDGGIISSKKLVIEPCKLEHPSVFFQLKSPLNVLQVAISYGRLGWPGKFLGLITGAADKLWQVVKKIINREDSGIHAPSSSGGGYGLDEDWIHKHASWFSRKMIEHQRFTEIGNKRRANFYRLLKAFENLPGTRPLFHELPQGTIPLVFPLYVENPRKYFSRLKYAAVPVWRFGEYLDPAVTEELCPVSTDLSARVFQFPCHQDLTESEITWMIDEIHSAFKQASRD